MNQVERYPTIARLADLSRGTIGYQGPELVAEAVQCWHELNRVLAAPAVQEVEVGEIPWFTLGFAKRTKVPQTTRVVELDEYEKLRALIERQSAELLEARKALLEISGAESTEEALDIFRRERAANVDLAASNATMSELLQEWLDTELDTLDEEFEPWLESFTERVGAALTGAKDV